MSRCILFSGGPLSDCDQVEVKVGPGDFVIACDAGCRTAAQFGVRPDLAVGDFDSLGEPVPEGILVQKVPAEKDDTDTMLGLRVGLEQGFREFLLVGGFGGRLGRQPTGARLALPAGRVGTDSLQPEPGVGGAVRHPCPAQARWMASFGVRVGRALPGCHARRAAIPPSGCGTDAQPADRRQQ